MYAHTYTVYSNVQYIEKGCLSKNPQQRESRKGRLTTTSLLGHLKRLN